MQSAGFRPIRFKKRSDTSPRLEQNVVKIEVETDEALILFELLTSDRLKNVIDAVETVVLANTLAALERVLVEPFREDYTALVADARKSVLSRYGSNPSSSKLIRKNLKSTYDVTSFTRAPLARRDESENRLVSSWDQS